VEFADSETLINALEGRKWQRSCHCEDSRESGRTKQSY